MFINNSIENFFDSREKNLLQLKQGGSRGLVVKVLALNSRVVSSRPTLGTGSFSKLRQFRLPYFASVYSAANEYKHCMEGTCDGLVSSLGESV